MSVTPSVTGNSAARERPILFSGPMVRAILAGQKTQTRRVIMGAPEDAERAWVGEPYDTSRGVKLLPFGVTFYFERGQSSPHRPSPYGQAGERLWVRETWEDSGLREPFSLARGGPTLPPVLYAADLPADWKGHTEYRRRQSIFMPRWASRLTLEITTVRVQRLQEITADDARAEGAPVGEMLPGSVNGEPAQVMAMDPRVAFAWLWDSINGKRAPWASNPWVWAITFRRAS